MAETGHKLSAFVVSYNRAAIIRTCLRSLHFADELIVVDKSSTDDTVRIASTLADRIVTVPWSPTVEETREFASSLCRYDWILFLDDDECLSAAAAGFVRGQLAAPDAEAFAFARRDYILGIHDERAYYWPEHHFRLFRRGALEFRNTVHSGLVLRTDRVMRIAPKTGVCIHHLSHQDTAQWLEKTNRYTSRADRVRVSHAGRDLVVFAQDRLAHWCARTRDTGPGEYPQAAALLRAVYDMIDRLKVWEEELGLDGAKRFQTLCESLEAGYPGGPERSGLAEPIIAVPPAAEPDAAEMLRRSVSGLRAEYDAAVERLTSEAGALRQELEVALAARVAADEQAARAEVSRRRMEVERLEAEKARYESERAWQEAVEARERAEASAAYAEARASHAESVLRAIESSTFWRATALPRRVIALVRRWRAVARFGVRAKRQAIAGGLPQR